MTDTALPFDPDVTATLADGWDGPEPEPHGCPNDAIRRVMVKSWSGVARAAETKGRTREHRLWTICHLLDFEGSGTVTVAVLQQELKRLKVKGTSDLTLKRLLRDGDGTFWYRQRNRQGQPIVRLRKPARVAYDLGCTDVGRAVYIAPSAMRTLQSFRVATVYASAHARSDPKGADPTFNKPISRKTLELVTGIERRKQQRWDKTLGRRLHVEMQGDFVGDPASFRRDAPQYHEVDGEYRHGLPSRFRKVKRAGGQRVLFEQMPSRYRIDRRYVRLAPSGRRRKTNKALRTRYNAAGCPVPTREIVPGLYYEWRGSDPDAVKALVRRLGELRPDEFVYQRGADVPGIEGYCKTLRCDDGQPIGVWHKTGNPSAQRGLFLQ